MSARHNIHAFLSDASRLFAPLKDGLPFFPWGGEVSIAAAWRDVGDAWRDVGDDMRTTSEQLRAAFLADINLALQGGAGPRLDPKARKKLEHLREVLLQHGGQDKSKPGVNKRRSPKAVRKAA